MKFILKHLPSVVPIILIIELGYIVYSNSFHCSFQFDDFISIVYNDKIRNLSNLAAIWNYWPTRFAAYLSFALNYHYSQNHEFSYHVVNVLIHLLASTVVWKLTSLIFSLPRTKDEPLSKHKDLIAVFSGLIFLCHPIQTQAVTYIVQRAASLAALFYVTSILLFLKFRLTRRTPFFVGSFVCAVLAMLSKENTITLPIIIFLCEVYFFGTNDWKIRIRRVAPFFVLLFLIPLITLISHSYSFSKMGRVSEELTFESAPIHYAFTQIKVIVTYLRLVIFPVNQSLYYDYPVVKNPMDWQLAACFSIIAALLVIAARFYKRNPIVSFSIAWFFVCLAPESSFFPIYDVIYEHRLYLPLVGFSILTPTLLYTAFGKKNPRTALIILMVIVSVFSVMTYQRNYVWQSEKTLLDDTVKKFPNLCMPYINRGFYYRKMGDFEMALSDYERAIKIRPEFHLPYFNRGNVYRLLDRFDEAIADYTQAIKFNPKHFLSLNNRGIVYFHQNRLKEAIADFDGVLRLNPQYGPAYTNRAKCIFKLKKVAPGQADSERVES